MWRAETTVTAFWIIVGACLLALPPETAEGFRAALRDVLGLGGRASAWALALTDDLRAEWDATRGAAGRVRELEAELAATRQELRSLQAQRIELDEAVPTASAGEPLLLPQTIEAVVLGGELLGPWKGRKVVSAGSGDGVVPELLVVDGDGTVLDQGSETDVTVGDLAISGRGVVGRIVTAGRWTSLLAPVTADGFRRHARILRKTPRGWTPGPEGIVEGDGGRLKLTGIKFTEPVHEGDEVFTTGDDLAIAAPMLFGRIAAAELPAGALEWEITLAPATDSARPLRRVAVLRSRLNPVRVVAQ